MNLNLSEQDKQQLRDHGLTEDAIRQQLQRFADGVPFTVLDRACTVGDGIKRLDDGERAAAIRAHEAAAAAGRFSKFVPASGAASRMFKALLALLGDDRELNDNALKSRAKVGDKDAEFGLTFFGNLDKFAFYPQLADVFAQRGQDLEEVYDSGDYRAILAALLTDDGLNLAQLPKGLIAFHRVGDDLRTPLAEHFLEAHETVKSGNSAAALHFTVSPEHRDGFQAEAETVGARYGTTRFDVSFSVQSPSTDTIAADLENQPFRDNDGRLLFRPGGHGALLKNLNDLDADIVYIKNVDNVVPPAQVQTTLTEKRELGGYAAQLLANRDQALRDLEQECPEPSRLDEIGRFVMDELDVQLANWENLSTEDRVQVLHSTLNRPFRVCGMVINEGEPGGGPFWVKRSDGSIDRQIVETVQIDTSDDQQKAILESSTHFNPVDLVCCLRDHHGNSYDLDTYVDPSTAFISQKSKDGRDLKALELPGLWNGSMADWLTVFVEVPARTFNPVKTVNDLLRDEHQ